MSPPAESRYGKTPMRRNALAPGLLAALVTSAGSGLADSDFYLAIRFVPYDLRHTFATLMFDAGVPAPDVQQAMGHSSLQVTERYSRSRDNAAARNAPKLNEFLVSKRKSGPVIDPESGASL